MKTSLSTSALLAALPSRQRRKQARPRELIDAALELFVAKGFAATRTDEVAALAGVSKGTLYLYFSSKEELLKEVIRHHVVNRIDEGFELIRGFDGSSADLLAEVLRLWWERIGETPASGIVKLMMSEVRNFPELARFYVDEVVTPSHDMLALLLRRGIDSGEFRSLRVADTVNALIGPLVFLVLNKHSLGACAVAHSIDPKAVIEAQIDLVLNGLTASSRPLTPSPAATAPKQRARR